MSQALQRFCPLCDRAFNEGEAVLRCTGCGVMHHPGCWVRQDGCATEAEHAMNPVALAYPGTMPQPRPPVPPLEPLPPPLPPRAAPVDLPARMQRQSPGPAPGAPEPRSAPPPARERPAGKVPPPYAVRAETKPVQKARRRPPPSPHAPRPLPSIYKRHKILAYWYLPAAVLVMGTVALAVVWTVERFTGGDGEPAAAATPALSVTPATATATGAAFATGTPARGTATTAPAATPSPGSSTPGSRRFRVGEVVVVRGTGDCLNVRVGPARSNDAIVCLADGKEVSVVAGPEAGDGFQWWKLKTDLGEGWAVEDYLASKP